MAELINSKRAFLPSKQQRQFINKILLKIPIKKAANLCNISERTIRDWRRGKFSMDLKSIQILSKLTKISLPKNIKTKNKYWYVNNGSSAGGLAVLKKYGRIGGDPENRKNKWYEWWEKEGKFKKHPIINVRLPIKKPQKTRELAELFGILIGDGGITQNQTTITLNSVDDKEYSNFVIKFIKKLFGVQPSIYHDTKDSVNNITISRTELVDFLHSLGLPIGNKIKQKIDIPKWIKINKKFLIACLRGLVDTDGCVIKHSYIVDGKKYNYKKLAFSSRSEPLIKSVYNFLKKIGLSARITKDGKNVRIESKDDVKKYFKIIGSHNPKHLRRYHK